MTPAPTHTDEQRAALAARDTPVALGAGAGCGKTFILTERFLSHLRPADAGEPPAELGELVAITFTEAAAREMRERLRAKCRDRLAESGTPDDARFWRRLVRGLDSARVSTIHSFCGKLVRRHAIELGIDPGFAVIDGAESGVRLAAAVDESLRARMAPRDGAIDERFVRLAATLTVNNLREALLRLARVADTEAFAACLQAGPDSLVERWRAFYADTVAPQIAADLAASLDWDELRELLAVATPETAGLAEQLSALAPAMAAVEAGKDAVAAIEALTPLLKAKHANKDWPDAETKKRFTAVLKSLRDRIDKAPRLAGEEDLRPIAERTLEVAGIASDAADRYERDKRSRAELDQDDLLKHARRLLTDPATADARREVAEGVRVLLVDEFQDTDGLQANIVRALVSPPNTDGDGDVAAAGGRLFFVGDDKQSIYRFRGAEPQVFRDLRRATPDAGRLELSQNFRSQPAVLTFVNEVFAPLMGDGYVPLRPARPQTTATPAVELLWTPPPAAPDGERPPGADAKRRAEAATVAARLRTLLDGGEPVVADRRTGEPRPARPGDIALLFRTLSDSALYEEALRDAGVDYYLVGGQAFYTQQEVYDLVNLLRAIDSRCDEVALVGALRSPWFGLPDEAVWWLARRGGPVGGLAAGVDWGRLPDEAPATLRAVAERACATLRSLRRAKDRVGAAELLRLAIEATGYDAAVRAEFLGERQLANLAKLHEQARAADAAGSGLRGFVARLEEFTRKPPKEALAATTTDDAGVVRLMTVHASKGLEFPVVVLPDLDRKQRANTPVAAFRPDLGPVVRTPRGDGSARSAGEPIALFGHVESVAEQAEQDRLFYVACTRAADRLILSACVDPSGKTEGPWLERLARRIDLATGEDAPGFHSPSDEPLVAVVPPPTPIASSRSNDPGKKRGGLTDAIDAASQAKRPATQPLPATAAPITPAAGEFETFPVSRLSGKIGGDSAERSPAAVDSREYDARRFGTLVHAVIERLDPAGGTDIDALAAVLADEHLRRGVDRGAADAGALVRGFAESDTWAAMRRGEPLRRELEFLLPWEGSGEAPAATLRGYLDAAYRDPATGRWTVVDYKTNRVDAAGVPHAAEAYRLQLAVYAHALEAITGEPVERLRLHFLHADVAVDTPWSDDARRESIARIDDAIAEARASAVAEAARAADPLGELAAGPASNAT